MRADLDLGAIRRRCEAATPGPWAWANTGEKCYGANVGHSCFAEDDPDCLVPLSGEQTDNLVYADPIAEMMYQGCHENAEFIAHAREDIPALLAEVDRLRAALRPSEPVAWRCQWQRRSVWKTDLVTDDRSVMQQWEREQHGEEGTNWRVQKLYADIPAGEEENDG